MKFMRTSALVAGMAVAAGLTLAGAPSAHADDDSPAVQATVTVSPQQAIKALEMGPKPRSVAANADLIVSGLADAGIPLDRKLVEKAELTLAESGMSSESLIAILDASITPAADAGVDLTPIRNAVNGLLLKLTVGGPHHPDDMATEIINGIQGGARMMGVPYKYLTGLDTLGTKLDAQGTSTLNALIVSILN